MVFVEYNPGGRFLLEVEFLARFVHEFVAIRLDERSLDAVHHDDAIGSQYGQYLMHNLPQATTMSPNEDCIGMRQSGDVHFKEITYVDIDARGSETTGVLANDGLALGTNLEGLDVQMWELDARLNADAARTESDVPEDLPLWQVEGLQGQQTDGHLGYHLFPAIEQGELRIRNAEGLGVSDALALENHTVRMVEVAVRGFFEGERSDLLEIRVPQVFTYIHHIKCIAIFQHPPGNGRGCMFLVCEDAYLLSPFNERLVEFRPRAARERDDAQIVIRHPQSVGKHL